jgi:predicted transcriptional regulator
VRKRGRSSEIPPPLELECLKALWRLGEARVKDVRDVLTENRNLAYTTVMTLLDRLDRRGVVERRKQGRAFVYVPVMGREKARGLALKQLVDTYFGGSVDGLKAYLEGEQVADLPPARKASDLDPTLL